MTLMIQARHLFYGISMLDIYKGTGWKKWYLIFGMCDESFSINYSAEIPENVDRGWFMFFVTLFNHMYWFTGATIGGILGSLISFNTEGLAASVLCLVGFGADSFMIPTMICILVLLTILRQPIEKAGVKA